ncbi:MAG: formimidoylglutamase [Geobacteraceae bacterium GWC2_58_44]|nr:MAG: formimidoylglutamase [Geobacteraceae bacterium GWC2_58_44]HBG06582.1 formimidoylglutamase [Geobacter sp.]
MHKPVDMALWQGRIDAEPGAERWHQKVTTLTPVAVESREPGLALLGICCDIGVTRNLGRAGAQRGPDAIRAALASQAWHLPVPCYDAGNLYSVEDDLEGLQKEQAAWVGRLLDLGHFPLLLGGGHEIAFGSYLGLRAHVGSREERAVIGSINFDAHFDLRCSDRATSGTPFLQIADNCCKEGQTFRYFCLGISEVANTDALFQRAGSLGVRWLLDQQLTPWKLQLAEERLREFLQSCDHIHVSIDLDMLPASVAPGVSAPSPGGVSLEVVEHLLHFIKSEAGSKLKLAEIAECNPDFDSGGRTAKVAARLCHLVARKEPQ